MAYECCDDAEVIDLADHFTDMAEFFAANNEANRQRAIEALRLALDTVSDPLYAPTGEREDQ